MAFQGNQGIFADSLFHPHQHQAGVNVGGGNSGDGTIPVFSILNPSKQDQDTTSFLPWTQDDSKYSGKLTDTADCDREMNLQGLVSNILDEVESPDSCFDEGLLPRCNSTWPPKTMQEELLQHHKLDAKIQKNDLFPPNYIPQDDFSGAQHPSVGKDVEGLYQHLNGLTQQWLSKFPNGVDHFSSVQKMPQSLPISNGENIFQSQQCKYDRGNDQPVNNTPDLRDICIPPDEMNSFYFEPSDEDYCLQSSNRPTYHEQHLSEDINQLMLNLQSLVHSEQSVAFLDPISNMRKQTAGVNRDGSVAELWKTSTSAIHVPKELVGEVRPSLWELDAGVRRQAPKHDAFQYVPDFSSDNTSFHQQPKSGFAQMNLKKMPVHSENVHVNGYSEQRSQPNQMQSNAKPQTKKEKQRMLASGFRGESPPIRSRTYTPMRTGVNQPISQIPYLDLQGSVQPQKFDEENGSLPAGSMQKCTPTMYPVDDFRNPPRMSFDYNYSAPPNGSGVSGFAAASAMANSVLMNQGCLMVQFPVHLDECYEQWKCLENDRMRAEGFLMKTFPVKKNPARSNTNLSKVSSTSVIIDQLIDGQMREQTKVAGLLNKIKCVYRLSLHVNIHTALSQHHLAVCVLQERFKEGTAKLNKPQRRPGFTESKEVMLMDLALKELATATRRLRTMLWCSLQMTTPLSVETQDQKVHREDVAPCQGYSFVM